MFRLIFTLVYILTASGLMSQQLPNSYPKYVFKFEVTDSSEYSPIYFDYNSRDSIKSKFDNTLKAAQSVENYLIGTGEFDFICRQVDNPENWDIILVTGKTMKLEIPSYQKGSSYNFEHYYPEKELILFRVQYPEGHSYLLVDRVNGKKYYTWGPPQFAPSGRLFISLNGDLVAHYSANGIQLFSMKDREIQLLLAYDPKVEAPSRCSWINDTTLKLETYIWDPVVNQGRKTFYHYILKLDLSDL